MQNYSIERITNDNRRPGMPCEGFLVRYRPHDTYGWLSCHTCKTFAEAQGFASKLDSTGNLPL